MMGADPRRTSFSVLVVEDEFFIAMELESVLTGAGYRVLGPAATVRAALGLLADHRPDAAVLDVNLGSDRVTPVAEALADGSIPFVIASAYRAADLANEPALAGAIQLGKPTPPHLLLQALDGFLLGKR